MTTHAPELIALRRVLHSQPELSSAEFQTTEMLVERLAVEGLSPRVLTTGTGLICDIDMDPDGASGPGRVVALRADIDALAMDDLTDTPYRSRRPGVAHACGHDVHTAAVLGAALALLDIRRTAPRPGVVRIIFEPSEEVVPGGAVDVIAEGGLDGVAAFYGLHCDPKLETGLLGLRSGPLTSAADMFEITLSGPGGHTARPDTTVDLVRWTGWIADRLAKVIRANTAGDVAVVFGAVHSGAAANVIPATASLRGSFRAQDRDTWLQGERLVAEAVAHLVGETGRGPHPTWSVDYVRGVPIVTNDPHTTETVRHVGTALLGPLAVVDTPQSMGGDSFAWYTDIVPGTYIRLGTHDPKDLGERRDLHSATFDVDDEAIAIGAAVLASAALASLGDR